MVRKKITLNDLPKYSDWPARMIGLSTWTIKERTNKKTEQEYNKEKYLPCLERYEEMQGIVSVEEMRQFENGDENTEIAISLGDELFVTTLHEALSIYYNIIISELSTYVKSGNTVLELAAGYGYNLWLLKQKFPEEDILWLGGEYSENAVLLGQKFFTKIKNIKIEIFDLYQTPYTILEQAKGRVTVFTVFGAQQLPTAVSYLEGLRAYKHMIDRVVLFEPIDELYDNSLLGLMRKRYNQLCDYNTDLLTLLKAAPDIEIVSQKPNVIGLNPLLPMSIIVWKFS